MSDVVYVNQNDIKQCSIYFCSFEITYYQHFREIKYNHLLFFVDHKKDGFIFLPMRLTIQSIKSFNSFRILYGDEMDRLLVKYVIHLPP